MLALIYILIGFLNLAAAFDNDSILVMSPNAACTGTSKSPVVGTHPKILAYQYPIASDVEVADVTGTSRPDGGTDVEVMVVRAVGGSDGFISLIHLGALRTVVIVGVTETD